MLFKRDSEGHAQEPLCRGRLPDASHLPAPPPPDPWRCRPLQGMTPGRGPGPYLNVPAPGHLHEVLVMLQRLVHLVIRHAVASQTPFPGVIHLGKNDKLGHVGHRGQFLVQLGGKVHSFSRPGAVRQPEPERRAALSLSLGVWGRGVPSIQQDGL